MFDEGQCCDIVNGGRRGVNILHSVQRKTVPSRRIRLICGNILSSGNASYTIVAESILSAALPFRTAKNTQFIVIEPVLNHFSKWNAPCKSNKTQPETLSSHPLRACEIEHAPENHRQRTLYQLRVVRLSPSAKDRVFFPPFLSRNGAPGGEWKPSAG